MTARPPVVLAFHGVGHATDEEDPHRLVMTPEHLEAQLRMLLRLGYRFVAARELDPHRPPPPGTAVATFDDGWRDAITTVAPLLGRLGIPGSFYVCPGWWGQQHPLVSGEAGRTLSRDEARELAALGMEVAAHTLTHPDLRSLDDAELRRQLTEPREELTDLLGAPVTTLAYPYGLSDERVRAAAAAAGYALALGWLPGPWTAFDVPRLPGPPRHGAARLAVKLLLRARRPGR